MRQGFLIPGGFGYHHDLFLSPHPIKCDRKSRQFHKMAYWRLYYHLVWATKNRYPYLTQTKETKLYPYLINKADSLGCIVHAIGGIEDHIHLIVSIPPKLAISEFVKKIKGSSSRFLNNITDYSLQFAWQEGYGIFSLGGKQLDRAIAYVQNQKQHHANKTAIAALEIIQNRDDPPNI